MQSDHQDVIQFFCYFKVTTMTIIVFQISRDFCNVGIVECGGQVMF